MEIFDLHSLWVEYSGDVVEHDFSVIVSAVKKIN